MAKKTQNFDKGMMISTAANFAAALSFIIAGFIAPTNKVWFFIAGGVLIFAGIAMMIVLKRLKAKFNIR